MVHFIATVGIGIYVLIAIYTFLNGSALSGKIFFSFILSLLWPVYIVILLGISLYVSIYHYVKGSHLR